MMVIPFQIPRQKEVGLEIYDLLGRRVRLQEQSVSRRGFAWPFGMAAISIAGWWIAAYILSECWRDRLLPYKKLS